VPAVTQDLQIGGTWQALVLEHDITMTVATKIVMAKSRLNCWPIPTSRGRATVSHDPATDATKRDATKVAVEFQND